MDGNGETQRSGMGLGGMWVFRARNYWLKDIKVRGQVSREPGGGEPGHHYIISNKPMEGVLLKERVLKKSPQQHRLRREQEQSTWATTWRGVAPKGRTG